MSAQHTPGRIDSTAFRRGVRAAKTGATNPYNGPALRDEWEAGRSFAKARGSTTAIERAHAFVASMEAVDRTYDPEYMADGRAAIAKATGSAS